MRHVTCRKTRTSGARPREITGAEPMRSLPPVATTPRRNPGSEPEILDVDSQMSPSRYPESGHTLRLSLEAMGGGGMTAKSENPGRPTSGTDTPPSSPRAPGAPSSRAHEGADSPLRRLHTLPRQATAWLRSGPVSVVAALAKRGSFPSAHGRHRLRAVAGIPALRRGRRPHPGDGCAPGAGSGRHHQVD